VSSVLYLVETAGAAAFGLPARRLRESHAGCRRLALLLPPLALTLSPPLPLPPRN